MTERLALSADEVADALGVSVDVVYRAIRRDEIPAVRIGRRVLIPRRWLDELFDAPAERDRDGGPFT